MTLVRTSLIAARALTRHRLRAAFMMLGVTLGVASLTALASIGESTKQETMRRFKRMLGTFDTVIGKIKLENNMPVNAFPLIGQWQKGFFAGVAPAGPGMAAVVVPKAPWKQ